jgi:hypothetical protein
MDMLLQKYCGVCIIKKKLCGKDGYWVSEEECPKNFAKKIKRIINYLRYLKEEDNTIWELDETLVHSIRSRFSPGDIIAAEEQINKINGRMSFYVVVNHDEKLHQALLQMS